MQSFPMFVRTTGRRVVIAGGGEQAAQKARLMLKTDALIVLAAPALDPELAAMVTAGRAVHHAEPITPALFEGAAMAFIATGCPGLDAALHALAKTTACPVNVVDQPSLCDITTPSIVDRDPVVVAIGTEGTAPVLARQIKTRIEEILPPNLGGLAALAGRLRDRVARRIPKDERRAFWRWVFADAPRAAWTWGAEREAAELIKSAIETGRAPGQSGGSIALVGAGPGARDLLTLRAVQRLQEADVIFYDRLVEADVLEHARRDAERVHVGKVVGAHAWPQEKINAAIVAEARKGRRAVRLKSGDPGIFGRLTEELDAARAAGIPVEIVPGVTAASGAAAAAGIPLTARGETDTLVLTTGHLREDGTLPEHASLARPGTTLAFYMAMGSAAHIAAGLLRAGVPTHAPVTIVSNATKPDQMQLSTTVSGMAEAVARSGIKGCAVILLSLPKTEAAERPAPVVLADGGSAVESLAA